MLEFVVGCWLTSGIVAHIFHQRCFNSQHPLKPRPILHSILTGSIATLFGPWVIVSGPAWRALGVTRQNPEYIKAAERITDDPKDATHIFVESLKSSGFLQIDRTYEMVGARRKLTLSFGGRLDHQHTRVTLTIEKSPPIP